MNRRKGLPNNAAATAQYHAINAALGLPRRDAHIGGGRHVDQDTPQMMGWTREGCTLADGPGPTVYVVIDEATAAAVHGVTPPGHVTSGLAGRVAHDTAAEEWRVVPGQGTPAFARRPPVSP